VEDVRADVIVPAGPDEAFAVVSDLNNADWLPAVRGLKHVGGPPQGIGARYDVEAGLVGRHMRGTLVCIEMAAPSRFVLELEGEFDLTINVDVTTVAGGSRIEIGAKYSIRGFSGRAAERMSAPVARREASRAVEALAARFGRRTYDSAR
jgi:carbon monoxide dehydrogenase subunit G